MKTSELNFEQRQVLANAMWEVQADIRRAHDLQSADPKFIQDGEKIGDYLARRRAYLEKLQEGF